MKKNIFAFLAAGAWISISEFTRNELLFKSYWIEKYNSMGLVFPSDPLNNAMWGVWSFLLAGMILFLLKKIRFRETLAVVWIMAFVMMWIVTGNMNVLPFKLLIFAVPWSVLEVGIAAYIMKKIFVNR
jgi:hypothetical protein